jgi:hypothetical protein
MAPSSLPYQVSSTAVALSFDGIVIMSCGFYCYCVVVIVVGVVVFSVVCYVCCCIFVCSVVWFFAALEGI